ncbi:MAG: GLPGLI family protein, partial [Chlorobi bacterium]|nr:GLPGLI family protein [Chlorobiota bacterium]
FTPEESYYYVDAVEMPDDVANPVMYEISLHGAIRRGSFYQNARTREILNALEMRGTRYLLVDSLKNDWTITGETKTILGYPVIKAVKNCGGCKYPVEAWFTPQIPVPFGPAGFGGLPGLILEIKRYRQVLTAVKIKPLKKKPPIIKPSEGVRMTREEYENMLKKRRMEIRRRRQAQ